MSSESEYDGEEENSDSPHFGGYGLSQWHFNAYGHPQLVPYYHPQFVAYAQTHYGDFPMQYSTCCQPNQSNAYVYLSIDRHPPYEDDESYASDEISGECDDEDGNSSEYEEEGGSSEDYGCEDNEESEDKVWEDDDKSYLILVILATWI